MDRAKVRADGRWQYAGAEGALVFCADKSKGGLWFRVVDLGVSQAFVIIGYIIMNHQKESYKANALNRELMIVT